MEKEAKPREYIITAPQLQDVMKYLMSRPYAEVFHLMSVITTLKPIAVDGDKDVNKK